MKTAIILDIDRTIFDTNKFYRYLGEAVHNLYGESNFTKFTQFVEDSYKKHNTARLDMATRFIDADITIIMNETFMEKSFIYPDVLDFVSQHQNIFVLSMGLGGEIFQKLKLELSGLDLPLILIAEHNKSKWIYDNLLKNGKYIIEGREYDAIILCDDKPENFYGFGKLPNARGYLINRTAEMRLSPTIRDADITKISSLREINQ